MNHNRKVQFINALGVVSVAVMCAVSAIAEEPKRGTLPDGTPFRTDADGNQIVDYIAELEQAVDQLNRRVFGLEDELKEKEDLALRLQTQLRRSGHGSADGLGEKDLLVGKQNAEFDDVRDGATEERTRRSDARIQELAHENDSLQKRLQNEVERYESDLARRAAAIESLQNDVALLKTSAQSGVTKALAAKADEVRGIEARYTKELEALRLATMRADAEHLQAIEKLTQSNSELLGDVKRLTNELNASNQERQTALQRVAQLEKEQTEYRKAQSQKAQLQTVALTTAPVIPTRISPPIGEEFSSPSNVRAGESHKVAPALSDNVASLAVARGRAVESTKRRINDELAELKNLIAKRSAIYSEYGRSASQRVRFTLSKLSSSRGYTPTMIADAIRKATRITELSALSKDVSQISNKVREDIGLISRMVKVR
jgi:DNA repair exonuclease SbcCD ATPase subunit